MPYKNNNELPDRVKSALQDVPQAQDTYREAFNSAHDYYGEEGRAHAVAWSAVEKNYHKGNDGKWHPKD